MKLNTVILLAAAAGSAVAAPLKNAKRASSFECMFNLVLELSVGITNTHKYQGLEQASPGPNLVRAICPVSG